MGRTGSAWHRSLSQITGVHDKSDGNVRIKYNGDKEIKDKFYFTVFDGVGGWVDITPFHFETDFNIDVVEEFFEESNRPVLNYIFQIDLLSA